MEKPEQWQRIKEIVAVALERAPDQRTSFVIQACGDDQSIRAEVQSLLSAYESSIGLSNSELITQDGDATQLSKLLGPYRLVQKLGEGGMGQVWLAEQTAPVRRRVALKVVRSGMYDDSVVRRFHSERQLLAIMDHPAIAKVFDAGTTPDGQPYFVMEYVPGTAITAYCDRQELTIGKRLELFVGACQGVQHAHQKGIMHRDLKPANILVVEIDGKPVPRIIDFGLAKPLRPYFLDESLHTKIGGFLGTPGYMSPEQADPAILDVDTRTDVYSLGVILYELLTGTLPFDTAQWKKQRLEEILRHLREDEPLRPSTRVGSDRGTSTSRAQARGTDPVQLASALRGDLDWITIKALDKDRDRRYGSVAELAEDLQRFLQNEPVVARPASTSYRLGKYVLRHRVAVGVATGLVLLLVGFAGVQAVQLRRITRERDRADREAVAAKGVSDFLIGLFKVSDPSEARGNSITAREILDKGGKQIEDSLAGQPTVQARLLGTIGEVYSSLGLYTKAEPLLEKSLATRERLLGPEHRDTLRSMDLLGRNLERQGHYTEAEKLARETLDTRHRLLPPDDPEILASLQHLAAVTLDEGHFAEAEKLNRQLLDTALRVLGPEHPETVKSTFSLALSLADQGRAAEAEKLYRQALEIQRRNLGPGHPDTLVTMTSLARSLSEQGNYAEADSLLLETLEAKRRVLGPEHSETLWTMHDLGINLRSSGRLAEAEAMDRQTLEIRRRVLGPEHPETLMAMAELAETLDDLHHYAEAEKLYRSALSIQLRVLGPEHPGTALTRYNLACNLALTGRRDEALSLLHDAVVRGLSPVYAANMESDADLKSLRSDSRFTALIQYIKERASPLARAK
jgi:serine/threonine protein kinase